jgi:hypothetical protein
MKIVDIAETVVPIKSKISNAYIDFSQVSSAPTATDRSPCPPWLYGTRSPRSLFRLLADRFRSEVFDRMVFVHAAGGYYYSDKDLTVLQEEMWSYLDLGYSVVKMKIRGVELSEDLRRIEAVLDF